MNCLTVTAAAAALCVATSAAAQQTSQPSVPETQQAIAQQCLDDLVAFGKRVQEDGYWIPGAGYGWGYTVEPVDPGPWGTRPGVGVNSPRFQIMALFNAGNVLGHRGDEQACQAVLTELREIYDQRIGQLREAGIQPGHVLSWRQRVILEAKPVAQLSTVAFSLDHLRGADVRNLQDKWLGTIHDLVIDPKTGTLSYAILARGGFLGIGRAVRDYIAVPWQQFRATPGLNALVLDASKEAIANAPAVEQDIDATAFEQLRTQIDQYWQKQARS